MVNEMKMTTSIIYKNQLTFVLKKGFSIIPYQGVSVEDQICGKRVWNL